MEQLHANSPTVLHAALDNDPLALPITALDPSQPPPPARRIHAVVTLLWPYSSRTRACALLLGSPDFRLRRRRGQVRVRFAGPAAVALAAHRVGIGDRVLLSLAGASWITADADEARRTPGSSVEAELVFAGKLELHFSKAEGALGNGSSSRGGGVVRVDEPNLRTKMKVSARSDTVDAVQTPSRLSNGHALSPWMTPGFDSTVPVYASPAFVRRARLLEESMWGSSPLSIFDDLDEEEVIRPKKRPRYSIQGVKTWRYAERSPSPENVQHTKNLAALVDKQLLADGHADRISTMAAFDSVAGTDAPSLSRDSRLRSACETAVTGDHDLTAEELRPSAGLMNNDKSQTSDSSQVMQPPPLPRLSLPAKDTTLDTTSTAYATVSEADRPLTPKLQPIASETLPLPSPFPSDTPQLQLGNFSRDAQFSQIPSLADHLVSNDTSSFSMPQEQQDDHVPSHTEDADSSVERFGTQGHAFAALEDVPFASHHDQTNDTFIVGHDEDDGQKTLENSPDTTIRELTFIQELSDTEEDDGEMYSNRFTQPLHAGLILSQETSCDTEDATEDDADVRSQSAAPISEDTLNQNSRLPSQEDNHAFSNHVRTNESFTQSSDRGSAGLNTDHSMERLRENTHTIPQNNFYNRTGADIRTPDNDVPVSVDATHASSTPDTPMPQKGQKEDVMTQTFRSLFGFNAALAPDAPLVQNHGLTLTSQIPDAGLSHDSRISTTSQSPDSRDQSELTARNPGLVEFLPVEVEQPTRQLFDTGVSVTHVTSDDSQPLMTIDTADRDFAEVRDLTKKPFPDVYNLDGAGDISDEVKNRNSDAISKDIADQFGDGRAEQSYNLHTAAAEPDLAPEPSSITQEHIDISVPSKLDDASHEAFTSLPGIELGVSHSTIADVATTSYEPFTYPTAAEAASSSMGSEASRSTIPHQPSQNSQSRINTTALKELLPHSPFTNKQRLGTNEASTTLAAELQIPAELENIPEYSSDDVTTSTSVKDGVMDGIKASGNAQVPMTERDVKHVATGAQPLPSELKTVQDLFESKVLLDNEPTTTDVAFPSGIERSNHFGGRDESSPPLQSFKLPPDFSQAAKNRSPSPRHSPKRETVLPPSPFQTQETYHSQNLIVTSQSPETQAVTLPPTPQLTQTDSLLKETHEENENTDTAGLTSEIQEAKVGSESMSTAGIQSDAPQMQAANVATRNRLVPVSPVKTPARRSSRNLRRRTSSITSPEHDRSADALQQIASRETPAKRAVRRSHPQAVAESGSLSIVDIKATPTRRSSRLQAQADSQPIKMPSNAVADTSHRSNSVSLPGLQEDQAIKSNKDKAEETDIAPDEGTKTAAKVPETESITLVPSSVSKRSIKSSVTREVKGSIQPITRTPDQREQRRPTTRKSLMSRISSVPDIISPWFSPSSLRAKTQSENDAQEKGAVPTDHTSTLQGVATSLSYFTPLSKIEERLNAPVQSHAGNHVDILAVVVDKTKEPDRAKGGPRDYFTVFHVTDPSLAPKMSVRVEAFRPWHATLPVAQVGDVVLLRAYAVKSRKRQAYLLSTEASAWCVWRYVEDSEEHKPLKGPPQTRSQRTPHIDNVREEVKGPPVELGEEERQKAYELRTWWQRTGDGHG